MRHFVGMSITPSYETKECLDGRESKCNYKLFFRVVLINVHSTTYVDKINKGRRNI